MIIFKRVIDTNDSKGTLSDLANSGHSFYRFSQSIPGRSVEPYFVEYVPGIIAKAKDEDKLLSFVTEESIVDCFMYGDMLTKLNFDLNNDEFIKIRDIPYNYINNLFGEYESKYLSVEANYSLKDINTIVMLFDLVRSNRQLVSLFYFGLGSLDQRLHDWKFTESEDLVKYLKNEFEKNIHISPDEIRIKLREYMYNNKR